jgi:hypothetical protein
MRQESGVNLLLWSIVLQTAKTDLWCKHLVNIYSSVSRLLVLSGFSPDFTHLENTSGAIELYNEKKRRGKKLT